MRNLRHVFLGAAFARHRRRRRRLEGDLEQAGRELIHARDEADWKSALGVALVELYRPLISADSPAEAMAKAVLQQSLQLTGSSMGCVSAIDKENGHCCVPVAVSRPPDPLFPAADPAGMVIQPAPDGAYPGLRGVVLNTRKPFFTNEAAAHPAWKPLPDGHPRVDRFLSVPVIVDDKLAGQISLANPASDYSERDLRTIRRLADFYALSLQRRSAQERTQAALREKEILLREIHHRVKNNLQVISSLLNLQAGRMEDPRALEMLKESQNRVRSMAMVHEQLHRSRDLSRISFREYVRNLAATLFCSYGVHSSKVTLVIEIEETSLPIDTAIPCGLIIQELVSNALKHAFRDGRQGKVTIGLQSAGSNRRLTVQDNGIGLPAGFDLRNATSLGLHLVRILADQLEARVTCTSNGGTQFAIDFEEATADHATR